MTQDGQKGLAVTNDTQVTSDMTLKQRVSTDKEANDQDQLKPVIEKVLCPRPYRDHASVTLSGVLHTNVGHSNFRCVI